MRFIRKYWTILVLAACIAAALVFKRFTYVAWYPVMMSAAASAAFALSLLGGSSLCYTLAEKIPPHIMPPGAEKYCRKLTLFWSLWLVVNGIIAVATIFAPGPLWRLESAGLDIPAVWVAWNCCLSYCATGIFVLGELLLRRKLFAKVFHTSGSTAKPKKIVKTFDTLAKEVAFHHSRFLKRNIFPKSPTVNDQLPNTKHQSPNTQHPTPNTKHQTPNTQPPTPNTQCPTFLCTIEPEHMYGQLWRVLLPRVAQAPLVDETILTPESLLDHMRRAEKVFLVTTPSFLNRFSAYASQYEVPRNCVEIITSGALLTAETSAAAKKIFGIAPLEIFGSTETGGVASRRQGTVPEREFDWEVFEPVKVKRSEAGRLVVNSPFSFKKNFEMGDGVELSPDARSFKLLGRMDRLVKIAEQRVSLPEMEEKMKGIPEVGEAALAVLDGAHGPTLGAVVVLDREKADVSQGKKKLALALRQKCMEIFVKGTVPKRYRFVTELPRNAQGKVQSAMLKKILTTNLVEPFVSDEVQTENAWSATFVFDADAPYFKGHFPSIAVLPGVVQLGMAKHFAELFLRRSITISAVKKMKFTRVIVPGEQIQFSLVKKSENEIAYEYRKGENSCSSAVICF